MPDNAAMDNTRAESEIRQLVARYCDAVNRYNGKDWSATWAEDGRWYFLDQVHEGRQDILTFWEAVMAQLDFAVMLAGSAVLEVRGDSATGRWYTQEVVRTKGEHGRSITGVYDDTYSHIGGQWQIQSRRYHKLYEVPTDPHEVHTPYTPLPD